VEESKATNALVKTTEKQYKGDYFLSLKRIFQIIRGMFYQYWKCGLRAVK
jgi:hypothetical protein